MRGCFRDTIFPPKLIEGCAARSIGMERAVLFVLPMFELAVMAQQRAMKPPSVR